MPFTHSVAWSLTQLRQRVDTPLPTHPKVRFSGDDEFLSIVGPAFPKGFGPGGRVPSAAEELCSKMHLVADVDEEIPPAERVFRTVISQKYIAAFATLPALDLALVSSVLDDEHVAEIVVPLVVLHQLSFTSALLRMDDDAKRGPRLRQVLSQNPRLQSILERLNELHEGVTKDPEVISLYRRALEEQLTETEDAEERRVLLELLNELESGGSL